MRLRRFWPALAALAIVAAWTAPAHARIVDEVRISPVEDGYEIQVSFVAQLRYQNHVPNAKAREFYVQLKTENLPAVDPSIREFLRERVSVGWDTTSGIPLQEIVYEGTDPERPQMSFRFTKEVEVAVESAADLRSILVRVKAAREFKAVGPEKAAPSPGSGPALPEKGRIEDASLAPVLEAGRSALIAGENERAVQLYTKALLTAKGADRLQALELLGVAQERSAHLAHAKAEYEAYLKENASGPDADRVRQRLAAIVTGKPAEREALREPRRGALPKGFPFFVQNYGSFSQIYFRDQTIPEGGDIRLNRNDLSSDLDFNTRWKGEAVDFSARMTGGYQANFIGSEPDEQTLSSLFFDAKSKGPGKPYARLGRQTLTKGGVFGRFDGVHASANVTPQVKVNGVWGYPVESSRQTHVESDTEFYGVNFDFGTYLERWDFNTFFIEQTNSGIVDRRAVGGEARYFDPQKAFFALLDYDLFYQVVNIFMFNGHYTLPSKTTLNLVVDHRQTPLLTSNNAIQGQGVNSLAELKARFTDDDIHQLALDRTTNSNSATVGVTQDIRDNLQATAEFTASEIEGTLWSQGVEGSLKSGPDYSANFQLVASNIFMENDATIAGYTWTGTELFTNHSFQINSRFPVTQAVRVNPRFRIDFRQPKGEGNERTTVRPSLRIEYGVTRWMHLELEAGVEWIDETFAGTPQNSTESYVTAGYRLTF